MNRRLPRSFAVVALVLVPLLTVSVRSWACPFCSAVSQTLRQEISSMDTAVIAEALELREPREEGEVYVKVVKVLKGEELVAPGLEIKASYFGKVEPGRRFMLTGVDPPKFMWSSPLTVSERSEEYLAKIMTLSEDPQERLEFYQQYLEDPESMLARDAYDEFAVAPYADVEALGPKMDHDKLVQWIQNPETAADRKRLYLTMLGCCGTAADIPMLETMLVSTQPSAQVGLDALIACYLKLKGPDGLEVVNREFLTDKTTEYAAMYSAIQAIRFHGTETNVIPREKLVASMALVLEHRNLADLVIPDLARWEDWSQIERLVQMFKDATPEVNFVRVPIVNYLRACPLPEAKDALAELEKIDPVSVRRANTFFPQQTPAPPQKPATSSIPRVGEVYAAASVPQTEAEPSIQGDTLAGSPLTVPNPLTLLAVLASAGTSLWIVFWLVLIG